MNPQTALLISLLLGRALDAILVNVSKMTPEERSAALATEEAKTDDLLQQMRDAS